MPDERQGIWNEEVGAEQKELSNILGGGIMKKTAENFIRVACAIDEFSKCASLKFKTPNFITIPAYSVIMW